MISLQAFKSYRESALALGSLTLLLGANASGKSNAIEAIRFLSWLASGRRLDDLMSDVQAADQLIRGTIDGLTHPDCDRFQLGCQVGIYRWNDFLIEISVDDKGMRVTVEHIRGPGTVVPLYAVAGWMIPTRIRKPPRRVTVTSQGQSPNASSYRTRIGGRR